jgi:hypothetical protein
MKLNKYAVGATALAFMLIAGAITVSAYQGDYTQKGPNCTPERHEAMEQAFTDLDYSAWQELMNGKGRVKEVVNESNFAQFAEAHQLAESGDYEGADIIRKELGLRTKDGERVGAGYKGGDGMGQGTRQGRGNK